MVHRQSSAEPTLLRWILGVTSFLLELSEQRIGGLLTPS
jgi:hypothetical protein